MEKAIPALEIGDIVELRKKHPCGSTSWRVVRLGVDIGLVCLGCGRRILLPRSQFNKQFKRLAARNQDARDA